MMKWYRLAACTAALLAGSAMAQSWPAKPIRPLIPIAAGGATDQVARMMASELAELSDVVLRELGLAPAEIESLRKAGVVA